ncbi:unnamed protein product [Moneuplotes crassus]|uniref:Acyl-coenzyme A oxidase n=1 Tax=Euplotes crassus TaxID=5936 RepID=A0AAD1X7J5_EUPCR|nr:unnamed protein product [Moneuplotes crassus]
MINSNREKAIRRITLLKKHFDPSEDFNRELDNCTFDFDLALRVVNDLRPKVHHQVIAAVDSIMKQNHFKEKSREAARFKANYWVKKILSELYDRGVLTPHKVIDHPDLLNRCIMGISPFGGEISTKFAIQIGLYLKSIKNMGTEIHQDELLRAATLEDYGCFCLTELGHGSDVSKLETTAHFDPISNQFIFNSPTETSRKFWIGNLASTATKAVVFAQLIINGVRHGVHGFLIQIRDPEIHEPLYGLTIGDCGDKIGMQGIDNGWIMFDNFKVGKNSLLNKYADISPDGVYTSTITSKAKLMAVQLGSLSGGRIAITQVSNDCALAVSSGALRYWAVRKQFKNPKTKKETRLIDYSINHYRLITRFARHFVQHAGIAKITEFWDQFLQGGSGPDNKMTGFAHLISSVSKAIYTWNTFDTCSEGRQACGGLGFSSYNALGSIIPVMDLNRTWEGDNNVLMQQAGKLILQNLAYVFTEKPLMPTFEFLTSEIPLVTPFRKTLNDVTNLLKLLTIRAETLIHQTGMKLQFADDKVEAWDKLLPFNIYPMTFAYFDRFLLQNYVDFLARLEEDENTQKVFTLLGIVFAQKTITENGEFFKDYLTNGQMEELKETLMENLAKLRKEVVGLSYLLPFTDKMQGAISKFDMKPYKNFLDFVEKAERKSDYNFDDDVVIPSCS